MSIDRLIVVFFVYHLILDVGHPVCSRFSTSKADHTTVIVVHTISLVQREIKSKC